jgi:hypothetical protein
MVDVDGDLEMVAKVVSGEWIAVDDIINTGVTFALCRNNFLLTFNLHNIYSSYRSG